MNLNKQNENGRSMVEMLGVLAIIGVLSVAGIAGYTMAMKRYRANEIVNVASTFYMMAEAQYLVNNGATFGSNGTGGLALASIEKPFNTVDMSYDPGSQTVTVSGASDLCGTISKVFGDNNDFDIDCS